MRLPVVNCFKLLYNNIWYIHREYFVILIILLSLYYKYTHVWKHALVFLEQQEKE